jgi:hypothetical protein
MEEMQDASERRCKNMKKMKENERKNEENGRW